jgi:dTDP-4-dehydrorhamnose reductase
MSKILVTGGTGKLAFELKKHLAADYVGIEHWDFTYPINKGEYDLILHMGAYTDVRKAESEPDKCFAINAYGTFNLVNTYKDTPFVYISTEYANKPLGVYALSKRLGEEVVKCHPRHLIIRTSFKPTPFPFPKAYIDQYTQGDYVDVIAKLLSDIVMKWDRKTSDSIYLGTGRKTMFELARRTRVDVEPNHVADYVNATGAPIPYDYKD